MVVAGTDEVLVRREERVCTISSICSRERLEDWEVHRLVILVLVDDDSSSLILFIVVIFYSLVVGL